MTKSRDIHSGQVALVMVLIMTVVSALAVSVAGRSTVESRVQQMNVESTEAILTAQAALEEAISKNTAISGSVEVGKDYQVTMGDSGTSNITASVGGGETYEVNLEGAAGVSEVKVYWKPAAAGGVSSLFITDVKSTGGNTDYAYDSTGTNGFTQVSSGGTLDGVNYGFVSPPISITGSSKLLRITVLGDSAYLGVEPVGGSFPPQATEFRSVADLTSEEAKVRYGIEYVESKINQLPSVFDYALFSGGVITQ